ncbi:MAG TPA: potassium-transporting ATPase subunit KdpA [Bryobacteraceae bacterium]|nr:potassium-transporting ATPase subunit KdpA [Bryobacteraceae bacterium]
MTANGVLQIVIFLAVLVALTKPLGSFMAKVFSGERTFLHPLVRPLEKAVYRLCGIDEAAEQRWTGYAAALLAFSVVGMVMTYILLRVQQWLPLNPQGLGNVAADLSFNTAASFTTNTNWQFYTPESTMSYLSEMLALATHNFFSAALGIAVAIAFVRGFARHSVNTLGNFWVDLTRCTLYVLMPLAVIGALLLVSQGVIQNFHPYTKAATLEGSVQTFTQGPAASQEAIKMIGTNGGGFTNANSSHPFENPTPFSNFIQMEMIFLIPAGLTYTFGKMVRDTRQGWAIFAAMTVLFAAGFFTVYHFEQAGNPNIAKMGVETADTGTQPGGNMEGKEVRFGIANSALFTTITTDASCGAVNNMHDSLTPLAGLVPMVNIELGEVIFGGVGSGLYGMLMFAVLAVFIAGLMVGRTPEYLGKKIEQKEVKMVMLAVLVLAFTILGFAGSSVNQPGVGKAMSNSGPHGFSEVLYAFSSGTGNNGSAFAGLNPTFYLNVAMALAMLSGRFLMIVPLLAAAGSLARKKLVPVSAGTFPTHGPLFVVLLVGVVVIVGALTFFPALSLGPVVEHFLMHQGRLWS